jgi:hypothetical protein
MILGTYLIYKCPNCGRTTRRGNIISGNTFGSVLYSDGKQIAPMLPEFPYFIKCEKCKTFYWLNDENKAGEYEGRERFYRLKDESKWKDSDHARFLSSDEYLEAINLKVYKTNDEEQYLRRRLWWALNDKYRRDDEFVFNENDKDIYESNCIKLIDMLDKNEINDKITCAELYRNIGNYVECKNVLETIQEEKYNWIKEILLKECEKNNKKVIMLRG